jgi:hypothetical protein
MIFRILVDVDVDVVAGAVVQMDAVDSHCTTIVEEWCLVFYEGLRTSVDSQHIAWT